MKRKYKERRFFMPQKEREVTKCIAVNLTVRLAEKLEERRIETGKSKNTILVELIEAGFNLKAIQKSENL